MAERYSETTKPVKTQSKSSRASNTSCKSSRRTSRSSVGVAAAQARTKAEAARARATFAKRKIAIKVDKARFEANLESLHLEKEAAAATVVQKQMY